MGEFLSQSAPVLRDDPAAAMRWEFLRAVPDLPEPPPHDPVEGFARVLVLNLADELAQVPGAVEAWGRALALTTEEHGR